MRKSRSSKATAERFAHRTAPVWLAVLTVAAAALALSACGGNSSGNQAKGSVEDQLGFDQSSLLVRQSRAEARIRDCMKAQGFDYVPIDPAAQRAQLLGSGPGQDTEKQFGYYVSTLWGRGPQQQADPNERIRAGLSPAEQTAYDRALGGDNPGANFSDAFDTGDFTKLGGCRKKAIEAVFGGVQVLSEIQGKLDQLDERIVQDQRMVKATEKWSACLAAAGYHYTDPDAIDVDLQKRLEQIVGPVPGKFATGPPPGQSPQPYDHAALAALQRDELATWRADTSCEHRYITPVENVVRPQYETQFRQQNSALFGQVKQVR
jgi:hypothetical protein